MSQEDDINGRILEAAAAAAGANNQTGSAPVKNVETEIQISTEILIMLALLMLSITAGHYLKKSKHRYLQEAGLTTILGIIAGLRMSLFDMSIVLKE